MRTNRPELAEPMFRKCVEARRVYPGADHWQTAEAEGQWGACLAALGRFDEAETELLSSHAVLAKRRGPAHAATAESVEQIIHLYDAWGRPAEALQWRARRDAGS
jgi:hypothetical protein